MVVSIQEVMLMIRKKAMVYINVYMNGLVVINLRVIFRMILSMVKGSLVKPVVMYMKMIM